MSFLLVHLSFLHHLTRDTLQIGQGLTPLHLVVDKLTPQVLLSPSVTETIYDLYGWGSPEVIKHEAQRHAWCYQHQIPYGAYITTAGFYWHCEACMYEDEVLFHEIFDDLVRKIQHMNPGVGVRVEVQDRADRIIRSIWQPPQQIPVDKSSEV